MKNRSYLFILLFYTFLIITANKSIAQEINLPRRAYPLKFQKIYSHPGGTNIYTIQREIQENNFILSTNSGRKNFQVIQGSLLKPRTIIEFINLINYTHFMEMPDHIKNNRERFVRTFNFSLVYKIEYTHNGRVFKKNISFYPISLERDSPPELYRLKLIDLFIHSLFSDKEERKYKFWE